MLLENSSLATYPLGIPSCDRIQPIDPRDRETGSRAVGEAKVETEDLGEEMGGCRSVISSDDAGGLVMRRRLYALW